MNPRYLAYCRAIGLTPEQERARFKGSTTMHEFILWMGEAKAAFKAERAFDEDAFRYSIIGDPDGYTAWLQEYAERSHGS